MFNMLLAIFGVLFGAFGAMYNTPGTVMFLAQIGLSLMSLGYLYFATRDYFAESRTKFDVETPPSQKSEND